MYYVTGAEIAYSVYTVLLFAFEKAYLLYATVYLFLNRYIIYIVMVQNFGEDWSSVYKNLKLKHILVSIIMTTSKGIKTVIVILFIFIDIMNSV